MASIEKQTIFEIPMKEVADITILFNGSWHQTITRVWGRKKEINRHVFKIKEDDGWRWFECGDEMGEKILSLVAEFGKNKKELEFFLSPLRVKNIKPKSDFLNMWERFKRLFRGR